MRQVMKESGTVGERQESSFFMRVNTLIAALTLMPIRGPTPASQFLGKEQSLSWPSSLLSTVSQPPTIRLQSMLFFQSCSS